MNSELSYHEKFEQYLIASLAILAGLILIYLAMIGPLVLEQLHYKTSPSAKYQTIGQDIINLVLLAPALLIGGILLFLQKEQSKYFLIMTPVYLLYYALSYGIGMEWNNTDYSGNSQNYFGCFLYLIIAGLLIMMYVIPQFSNHDAPAFSRSQLLVYIPLVAIFLLIFAKMWLDEVIVVIDYGDTETGSYSAAPTLFWLIRYLDLGFTIPLGFISLYLLGTRQKTSYPYLLLFFGFFVTMIMAVNAMAGVMWYYNDPELQRGDLFVFIILAVLSIVGYGFLLKDKIRRIINRLVVSVYVIKNYVVDV